MDKLNEVLEKEMRGIYNGIFPFLAKEIISAIIEDRNNIISNLELGCEEQTYDSNGDEIVCGDVPDDHQIYCLKCSTKINLLKEEIKELQEAMETLK